MRTWRTLKAATECHGSHGSISNSKSEDSSGGGSVSMARFTPAAYASKASRVEGDMAATSFLAAVARSRRRARMSAATALRPAISATRPVARRRSWSIWKRRSSAQAKPMAKKASLLDRARIWAMPYGSRSICTAPERAATSGGRLTSGSPRLRLLRS